MVSTRDKTHIVEEVAINSPLLFDTKIMAGEMMQKMTVTIPYLNLMPATIAHKSPTVDTIARGHPSPHLPN